MSEKPSHIVEAAGGIPYRWVRPTGEANEVAKSRVDTATYRVPSLVSTGNGKNSFSTQPDGGKSDKTNTSDKPAKQHRKKKHRHGTARAQATFPGLEVCMVHRPKYDDWSWPKGKLEENESNRHAAVREMEEETGVPVALGPKLGEVDYPLDAEGTNAKRTKASPVSTKHVTYWMARPITDEDSRRREPAIGPINPAKDSEVDEVRWMSIPKARKRLSHAHDREILDLFVERIRQGALESRTVIIVRHSKAESRKHWNGTDANRPITPRGASASFALNQELACYNPSQLFSSPWLRCMETIEPYAWHTNLPVIPVPELTEDSFASDPDKAWQRIEEDINFLLDDNEGIGGGNVGNGDSDETTATRDDSHQTKAEAHQAAMDEKMYATVPRTSAMRDLVDGGKHIGEADGPSGGEKGETPVSAKDDGKHTDKTNDKKRSDTDDKRVENTVATSAMQTASAQNPGNADISAKAVEYSRATAICMHRPVIGGIFEHLRTICSSKTLAKQLIAKSPYMPTGNAVALFVIRTPDGPRIIDIQRMAPLVY
ncbi:NUDIX hydrolase [Bifidobacterium sp. ESL0790]|uniref:NUDIX hydrolase n=1 Tax=Bifidobacterium sp. ESL0790 TaxID=2983233 RepID=UPI0023F685E1|nr:NUDIX hydrolase [Bifidobacterium sp. ESL0790]WEV72583.1 NUDIX hydrolase [Bifidobacterium sp. ESL0790]